eukprot:2018521-Prymnesium_polylepis.1
MFPSCHALQLGFGFGGSAESDLESVHVKLDNISATLGATLLVPAASLEAPRPRRPPPLSHMRRHPSS